jgi:regulator of protease activity HflC (stomatin/prohibitin superfamily)
MYVFMGEVEFILTGGVLGAMFLLSGIKVVRPSLRGVVESKGKIKKFCLPGTVFVLPVFQKLHTVDVSETRLPIKYYPVMTKDGIELKLDVDVYYKISDLPESIVAILYKQKDYKSRIVNMIKAELTELFLQYKLKDVPQDPLRLKHTARTGLTPSNYFSVSRLEFKKITPPDEVRDSYLKKVKMDDERQITKAKIEDEKQKVKELERLEKEKSMLKKRQKDLDEIEEKKRLERIAQEETKQIELLQEGWDEAYRKNEALLKRIVNEGKKKGIEKIKENKK